MGFAEREVDTTWRCCAPFLANNCERRNAGSRRWCCSDCSAEIGTPLPFFIELLESVFGGQGRSPRFTGGSWIFIVLPYPRGGFLTEQDYTKTARGEKETQFVFVSSRHPFLTQRRVGHRALNRKCGAEHCKTTWIDRRLLSRHERPALRMNAVRCHHHVRPDHLPVRKLNPALVLCLSVTR
jgi:hypothetical protein